jgi:hypothetical protein
MRLGGSRHLRRGHRDQGGGNKGKNRLFHFYLPIGRVLLRGKCASRLTPYPRDSVAGCKLSLPPPSRSGEQIF